MTRDALRLAVVLLACLAVASLVGLFVGGGLAYLLGAAGLRDLIVLALGGAISAVAAARTLPARSRPLLPAFGVQGAHAVWLLTSVLIHAQWGGLIDVLAIAAPLIWLGIRPERLPATVLLGAHGVESLLLLAQWASARDPGLLLPLLITHLALRLAGVLLTVRALQTIWRRERRRPPAARVALG